jgi:hypothetical protein
MFRLMVDKKILKKSIAKKQTQSFQWLIRNLPYKLPIRLPKMKIGHLLSEHAVFLLHIKKQLMYSFGVDVEGEVPSWSRLHAYIRFEELN